MFKHIIPPELLVLKIYIMEILIYSDVVTKGSLNSASLATIM